VSAELLSALEVERYNRQLRVDEVGAAGQLMLKNASVLVIGAGGLGCPAALYLAAAGVGSLVVMDGDRIERSNLHRQVAFTDADVGACKAQVLARRLQALNPDIHVRADNRFAAGDNLEALVAQADLVVDCCDNFAARYLINDTCLALGKPWLFAAINGFCGSFALFVPGGACFRCVYPEAPAAGGNCDSQGVLGTVPGVLALHQANAALQCLLGLETSAQNRLLVQDCRSLSLRGFALSRNPGCRCHRYPAEKAARRETASFAEGEISWTQWRDLAQDSNALLVDVRSDVEHNRENAGGECLTREALVDVLNAKPEKTVGLYCSSGKRSFALMAELRAQGFVRVFSLRGGVDA